jgi:hypothetical protein
MEPPEIRFLDWQNCPAHPVAFIVVRWEGPLLLDTRSRPWTGPWYREQNFTLYAFPDQECADAYVRVCSARKLPYARIDADQAARWIRYGLPAVLHETTVPGVASAFGHLKLDPFCERHVRPLC